MPKTFRLDATGVECPIPALRTQRALRKLHPGDMLEVRCTDRMAQIDIPALLLKTGDTLIEIAVSEGVITIVIQKI
jgi:tRNA 2-thiouridine synthesizing protein A